MKTNKQVNWLLVCALFTSLLYGYSIKQIEDGLKGRSSWNGWCEGMRDKHDNPTEGNLNQLFTNWF